MPRTVELLCKASLLGGPRAPTGHPKEARLECCGQRPGQGCPELPGGCPSAVLSSPSPPQKTAPPHPPPASGAGLQPVGVPGIWASPGPALGQASALPRVSLQQRDPLPVPRPHRCHPPALGEHGVSVLATGLGRWGLASRPEGQGSG